MQTVYSVAVCLFLTLLLLEKLSWSYELEILRCLWTSLPKGMRTLFTNTGNHDDKAVSFRLFAPCNSVSYLVVLFCKSLISTNVFQLRVLNAANAVNVSSLSSLLIRVFLLSSIAWLFDLG